MPGKVSLRGARAVLSAEVDAIRRRDPDLDPGDITSFTLPLLVRAVGGGRPGAAHRHPQRRH